MVSLLRAQDHKENVGDLIYGFNGGFNYSTLKLEDESVKPAARPYAGLYGNLVASERWWLQGKRTSFDEGFGIE